MLNVEVVSGGTDNHLFTINVKSSYGLTGKEASTILQENNITVNNIDLCVHVHSHNASGLNEVLELYYSY